MERESEGAEDTEEREWGQKEAIKGSEGERD